MADSGDRSEEGFRQDARSWLEANFPPSLKGYRPYSEEEEAPETTREVSEWRTRMGAKGWGVPTWPKEYGGGGLSRNEARVLREEMARIGAWNPIGGLGVMMFGPTLLEYGTEAQKQQHIPRIARGEIAWCQGFSEPGAGSDLASLQTRCEDKGDHFLINGQKIWTSGANLADWCFCLVRTDTTRKHEGISFVLIDMRTPGVEARPIKLIAGSSPFCETFFTDVKVPKENLVGPLNTGWTIAKRLLQHERESLSTAGGGGGGGMFSTGRALDEVSKRYIGEDEDGLLADADLRTRLSVHEIERDAYRLTAARTIAEARSNQGPSPATSIMKNATTKAGQENAELTVELMGSQGLGWEGDNYTEEELTAVRSWLHGKAATIAGGSTEVQYNIVAKRILGLPDPIPVKKAG